MSDDTLIIDGKLVTERNASRFVKARRPNAKVSRETDRGLLGRRTYYLVRDRSPGTLSWCSATAPTAGSAWLKVARQMVEHDRHVAAQVEAIEDAEHALLTANDDTMKRVAALRYAAVRIEQDRTFPSRSGAASVLRALADKEGTP